MELTGKIDKENRNKDSLTGVLSRRMEAKADTRGQMLEQIGLLENHYILCGGGRTGRHVIDRFCETQTPFVVVEQDPDVIDQLEQIALERGEILYYIQGDATEDESLKLAGINKAAGLIIALDDDKENLFVILTARSLNPHLRIVTRVSDEKHNREKMFKAGANRVVSTSAIGGLRMASEMIRPEVVKFLDHMLTNTDKEKTLRFTEVSLSSIKVPALASIIDANRRNVEHAPKLRVKDIGQHTGLLVVAVKIPHVDRPASVAEDDVFHMKRRYRFAPRGHLELHPDDILVVIGTQDKLDEVLDQ